MIYYIKKLTPLAFAAVFMLVSCSDSKKSTEEKTEITTMDSTTKTVKESISKMEDQTKKVEESLEKLDKEFETTK